VVAEVDPKKTIRAPALSAVRRESGESGPPVGDLRIEGYIQGKQVIVEDDVWPRP
jgi:hypothetical protein